MTAVRTGGWSPLSLWTRLSLRTRLVLIAWGLLAASLAVGNVVAVTALERYQLDRIDRQLTSLAELLAGAPYVVEPDPRPPPPFAGRVSELLGVSYLAYLLPDGEVRQPPSVLGWLSPPAGPAVTALDPAAVADRAGQPFDLPAVTGDGRWRVVVVPLQPVALPPDGAATGDPAVADGASVVVATSRADADATVARLRAVTLIVSAGLPVLLAVAGWYAVGAGLRPLRRIEETAAAIAAGDLSRRVPQVAAPGTEVGRLSTALNGMLGQVERAFAARADSETRMRRFVADVSHELRTPLFGIHGSTELYRMGGLPERADVDRTMDRIARESTRLAQLAVDLLLLARLDESAAGGAPALHPTPMDLRTLAADAYHDLRMLDADRPVTLTGPGGGPAGLAPVLADEARLRQVVANLVGNAVAHTPPGTPVRVGVGTIPGDGDGPDEAVLEFADDGPGLVPEQAERVFDRFYRGDDSRSRESGAGGAGLGLAIARSLVAAHGGRIELVTAPGDGATFRVLLPTHRP